MIETSSGFGGIAVAVHVRQMEIELVGTKGSAGAAAAATTDSGGGAHSERALELAERFRALAATFPPGVEPRGERRLEEVGGDDPPAALLAAAAVEGAGVAWAQPTAGVVGGEEEADVQEGRIAELGCTWQGPYSSRKAHLAFECGFRSVACGSGCGLTLLERLRGPHEASDGPRSTIRQDVLFAVGPRELP